MTKEDALRLPFDEYMRACWAFVAQRVEQDHVARAVYESGQGHGGDAFLEALWARRYWFNKVETNA